MKIYPAIDILNGQAVRLYQGQYNKVTNYSNAPREVVEKYILEGAKYLHIVDLDGARHGVPVNSKIIAEIAGLYDLKIQVGGGLRTLGDMKSIIGMGIDRVIIGSLAIKDENKCRQAFDVLTPNRITLALDVVKDGDGNYVVATHGWEKSSQMTLFQVIEKYLEVGLKYVLCTDISKDGTLQGPNFVLYQKIQKKYPQIELQASGGVHSLDDIKELKKNNMAAAIIGKALYEKKFTLREALQC